MPEDDKVFEIWQEIGGKELIYLGSVPSKAIITTFLDLHSLVIMGHIKCDDDEIRSFLKNAFINRHYLNLKITDCKKTYSGRFYISSYDPFSNHSVFRSTGKIVYEIAETITNNLNSCA